MFKKSSIKKICLATFCLIIAFVIYLFPKNINKEENFTPKTSYTVANSKDTVYLIDKNKYVARVNIPISSETFDEKVETIIAYLTIGSEEEALIPNGFSPIIPLGTTLLSKRLDDGNLKVDFSEEFLNVSEEDEIRLIEALVYSLTSIEGVNSITIFVDGEILSRLPHSQEFLDNPLDRSYGINKTYDIDDVKGTAKTIMYYLSKYDGYYYYVPVTKVSNEKSEKIEVIIKELSSSPVYETSLMSYLNSEATLQNYEIMDKSLALDFNSAILSDIVSEDILEEVTFAINLSIKDNYDFDSVSYLVNSKEIATFDLKSLE